MGSGFRSWPRRLRITLELGYIVHFCGYLGDPGRVRVRVEALAEPQPLKEAQPKREIMI